MKLAISYFYQIRNFPKNYIPMSTCLIDPAWYHNNQGENYIYKDKRGILNGLRLQPIIVHNWECGCPCEEKNPQTCNFLKEYRQLLNTVDFEKMYTGIKNFADRYQKENNIKEEIIMTLIVYEAPNNPCSERQALIDYFLSKGIELQEFQPRKDI